MNERNLNHLALRIETMMRKPTHGWNPGDAMEFRNHLPGGRALKALPAPVWLREAAGTAVGGEKVELIRKRWRDWLFTIQRLESLARNNDPRNPKRMMRDMARGKWPKF